MTTRCSATAQIARVVIRHS